MLSAAMSGRVLRCSTRALIGPAPPVDQLMRTGERLWISSLMRRKVSASQVGAPSSVRAWTCTMAAPASCARRASSPSSAGVYGMAGQCFLLVTAPVRAQERITLSPLIVDIRSLYQLIEDPVPLGAGRPGAQRRDALDEDLGRAVVRVDGEEPAQPILRRLPAPGPIIGQRVAEL